MASRRLNLLIPDALAAVLSIEASKEQMTMAEIVRLALREFRDRRAAAPAIPTVVKNKPLLQRDIKAQDKRMLRLNSHRDRNGAYTCANGTRDQRWTWRGYDEHAMSVTVDGRLPGHMGKLLEDELAENDQLREHWFTVENVTPEERVELDELLANGPATVKL